MSKNFILAAAGLLLIIHTYEGRLTFEKTKGRMIQERAEEIADVSYYIQKQLELNTAELTALRQEISKLKPTVRTIVKTKVVYQKVEVAAAAKELPQNRIALGMGLGTDGIVYRKADRTVRERVGTVISADYARRFTNGNSVGIGVQSNKSVVIKLGKDF